MLFYYQRKVKYIHTTMLCLLDGETLCGILTGKLQIVRAMPKKLSHSGRSIEVKYATL